MNYKLYPIKYEVYDPEVDALCAGAGIYTGSWFITPNKIIYFKEF